MYDADNRRRSYPLLVWLDSPLALLLPLLHAMRRALRMIAVSKSFQDRLDSIIYVFTDQPPT